MTSHPRQGGVYDVRGYILRETDEAIQVDVDGEKIWFPLSQVEEIHRENGPEMDWLVVTKWIAQKKGLV